MKQEFIKLIINYIRQETDLIDNNFVTDQEIIHYIDKYKFSDVIKAIRVKQNLASW